MLLTGRRARPGEFYTRSEDLFFLYLRARNEMTARILGGQIDRDVDLVIEAA
jgi:hypothetical protein